MKRALKFTVVIFLAIVSAGCGGGVSEARPSYRDCGANQQPACRATFRALIEHGRTLDGKKVRVEGYLSVVRSLFVLNSSKELYEAGVSDELSIRIRGPIDVQREMFAKFAYSWVSVTGTFRLVERVGTTDDLLIGELHAPMQVDSLRIPGPVRKAEFRDVAVDLEDIK